ncbi:hypothetical protein KJ766_02245, partial [Patescibacteria group bacterium]|nr:hypothetical protein [Patescibacteria group bacterium]
KGVDEAKRHVKHEAQSRIRTDKTINIQWGRIFLGTMLLVVGFIFLAKNFGWLPASNISIFQFWPLIIIFFGLCILPSRGWPGAIIGFFALMGAISSVAFAVIFSSQYSSELVQYPIDVQQIDGVTDAIVVVQYDSGALHVKDSSDNFISGFLMSDYSQLKTASRLEGDSSQRVTIDSDGPRFLLWKEGGDFMDLLLPANIPVDMYIDSGAVDMDLDFTDVILEGLDIDTGMSKIDIELGEVLDGSVVRIDSGVSDLHIVIPKGLGVELTVNAGPVSKQIEGFTPVDGGHYLSENYQLSEVKIKMTISTGLSNLVIDWSE